MKFKVSSFPIKYLGFPLGANHTRVTLWDQVIFKIESKLAGWKSNLITMGGRVTLIKSVLRSLPMYLISIFKILLIVANKMEAYLRRFLWGGDINTKKTHWVN